jgi:hypothetical protein
MLLLAGVVVATSAGGCAPKKRPTQTARAEPNPPSPLVTDSGARASALQQRSQQLQQLVKQLPGRTPEEDRRLVAQAFEAASGALELLAGPNPGGALRQELRILDNTRNFLTGSSPSVSPEPSIDTGLRSLRDALVNVRERLFPDDRKLSQQLDALSGQIRELDTVRGATHALIVAQSFDAAATVIGTMSSELQARSAPAAAAAQQSNKAQPQAAPQGTPKPAPGRAAHAAPSSATAPAGRSPQ